MKKKIIKKEKKSKKDKKKVDLFNFCFILFFFIVNIMLFVFEMKVIY